MNAPRTLLEKWFKLDANGQGCEACIGAAKAVTVKATLLNGTSWGARTLLVKWRTPDGVSEDFSTARVLSASTTSVQLLAADLAGRPIVTVEMGGSAGTAGAVVVVEIVAG